LTDPLWANPACAGTGARLPAFFAAFLNALLCARPPAKRHIEMITSSRNAAAMENRISSFCFPAGGTGNGGTPD